MQRSLAIPSAEGLRHVSGVAASSSLVLWDADLLRQQARNHEAVLLRDFSTLRPSLDRPFPLAPVESLKGLFGDLNSPDHMLRTQPLDWCWPLREPDCTRTLARQIEHRDLAVRAMRVQALLAALASPGHEDAEFERATVTAEAPLKNGMRVDLLVRIPCDGRTYLVLVEAKLGHGISPGQLPAYRAYARGLQTRDDGPPPDLVVLGLSRRESDGRALRRNRDWRFRRWSDLLLGLERALPPEADDDRFRLFRSTLWSQLSPLSPKDHP